MRYLITFSCYGGRPTETTEARWTDAIISSAADGSRPLWNVSRQNVEAMLQEPYAFDRTAREVVLGALRQHCNYRGWNLLAAHARSNHVHVIVEAEIRPERIMSEFKVYASRELNRVGSDGPARMRWARHGGTRWLWKDEDVMRVLQYVIDDQGEPMELFVAEEL